MAHQSSVERASVTRYEPQIDIKDETDLTPSDSQPPGVDVASNDPRFTCKTSDVTNASNGDTIVIDSVTYKVRIAEADGTGITILVLEKQ